MSKVVLGGGVGGLSAAHYLLKNTPPNSVSLIEASTRTGGWIKSNIINNSIFEEGPRTIRPKGEAGANTLQLLEELNLSKEIIPITSNHPAAKNRMIYANGSLHLLPNSLAGLFRKQKFLKKPLISYLMNDLKNGKKTVEDETIYDFVERRFGTEIADYLISPMICGICAGNAKEISVNFLMGSLFQYEQKYGSISKGILRDIFQNEKRYERGSLAIKAQSEKWSIYSFANGCETLPLALRTNLEDNGVQIKLNKKCDSIKFETNKVTLNFESEQIETKHLISAIPAQNLAHLLPEQHNVLAKYLREMTRNVSVAVINLQYEEDLITEKGFGLLVAPKENLPILGIIFDSCCFDSSDTKLTVMMGGYWFEQHFGKNPSEDKLLGVALTQIKNILKINKKPTTYKVNVLNQCLPQYIVGHQRNLKLVNNYIKENHLPLSLCGASYHGVGINDVILSAKKAVENLK